MNIRPAIVLAAACALAWPSFSHAQTALRWDLQPGEKLAVEVTQQTVSDVAYAGKKTTTQIDLTMHIRWEVIAVEQGKMRIKQSLTRLAIDMALGDGGRLAYDSAEPGKPAGRVRDLAEAVAPLVAAELEITMNQRGELLDVKPANEAAQKLLEPAKSPKQPAPSGLAAKETIQQLLRQPLVVLPAEPVAADEKWSIQTELDTALGKARQTTNYHYAGPVEQGGVKLDKIEMEAALRLEDTAGNGGKLKIREHEQRGTIFFDSASGRLTSAEQAQRLVTERPYRETTIVVTLTSKQQTVVKPAGTL